MLVPVEALEDVREEAYIAGEGHAAFASEAELLLSYFEEAVEDGEVEEKHGDGERLLFVTDKDGEAAGGRVFRVVEGAVADFLPPHHDLLQPHDLANLVDLL